MVFRVLLASILILGQARSMAQIERLTTKDEVAQFVHKLVPDYGSLSSQFSFRVTTQSSWDSVVQAYHLQTFEKADLDGNGMTDLVFNGSKFSYSHLPIPVSLAILSFGNDSFYVRDLDLDHFEDLAAHPILLDGKPYIQMIRVTQSHNGNEYHPEWHIDTLACKFNTFIEKKLPVKRKITQIDYNSRNVLAYWGDITLRIINDSIRLKKQRLEGFDGLDSGGVFLTRLAPNTSQKLYGLLDAMDFASLKAGYNIDASDASTGTFKITYDNGQTKMITDYGTCGTYGLAELHRLIYDLTSTQRWVNADPPSPRCIDSLHSDREVLGLVRTLNMDYPFLDFEPDTPVHVLPDYRERLIAFGQQRWQKGDIDGNGYADLLFNGYSNKEKGANQCSIIVLSFGNDSLRQQEISGANVFFAARMIRNSGHDVVQIKNLEAVNDSSQIKGYRLVAREDTLTASDGQILELPPPALHHIETLKVREEIDNDSVVLMRDTIYWYKNDASPPDISGASVVHHKDSINLYTLSDPKASQKLLSIAAGIRFELLNPDLLLPSKFMRGFGSTWYVDYDGGKRSQFTSDGLIGSYRIHALGIYLWDLKHTRTDWKFVAHIQ